MSLFNATTTAHDVSFHLLHKKTHNRIRMVPHDPDLGPVERSDLVKGYEVEKNKHVVLTNDEIASVRLESTRNIDIERFVNAAEIDRIYWKDPYYLASNDDAGRDAYVVIRDAMVSTGMVALGRLVMHTRERIVAIEPRGAGLLLTTLRTQDEIRDENEFFKDNESLRVDKKMREIAEKIIEQQTEEFEPGVFTDRYEDALRDLIRRKQKGQKSVSTPPPAAGNNVIDLMSALRRSLKASGRRPQPRRATAKGRRGAGTHHRKAG